MPRWYRRRRSRRSTRRGSVVPLLALLVVAVIALLVVNGEDLDFEMPRVNLPPLPNITIPITGLPEVRIPEVQVPVTLSPGDLPEIRVEGTPVPDAGTDLRERTKSSGCLIQGSLPDPACTPGSVVTRDSAQVCAAGYAAGAGVVPESLKADVYAAYGITNPVPGDYQIDHLVPLSLGGSSDISNLWPNPVAPEPGYNEKDRVEAYLQQQVCSGNMSLEQAQEQIATNWVGIYLDMPK